MNNLTTCAFKSANSRDIIATVSASGIERGSVLAEVHDSFGTLTHLSLRADVAINDLNSSFAASERSKNAEQALEQLHSINQNDSLSDPFGDDFLSDELDSVSLNHSDDLLRGFSDDNDSALEAPHYFFASNNRKNNENLSVSERKDNELHSATSDINPTPPQMPKTGRNDAYTRNERITSSIAAMTLLAVALIMLLPMVISLKMLQPMVSQVAVMNYPHQTPPPRL